MKKSAWWLQRLIWIVALLLWSQPSHAYPWMIQHKYTGCTACHVDPSGGYLLTAYGRAQTQTLLSTFGRGPEGNEVTRLSNFAGVMPPNETINLGATLRESYLWSKSLSPSQAATTSWILMQADLRAAVTVDRIIATGSIGFLQVGSQPEQITTGNKNVLVSREHWIGVQLGEDRNTVVRAGRMYLPFGIRVIEHPFYVRTNTGTNIDGQQQLGASVFHEEDSYRFELMAIAGNYQINPDAYRERGYSGYVELNAGSGAQVGLSSKVTYANIDAATYGRHSFFGAHGPMARWSPIDHVAVLSEVDLLHLSSAGVLTKYGMAAMAQVDWEITRGLHTMVTGELYHGPELNDATGHHFFNRDWLSFVWFAVPHIDLRLDSYWATEEYAPPTRVNSVAALGILHVSL